LTYLEQVSRTDRQAGRQAGRQTGRKVAYKIYKYSLPSLSETIVAMLANTV